MKKIRCKVITLVFHRLPLMYIIPYIIIYQNAANFNRILAFIYNNYRILPIDIKGDV